MTEILYKIRREVKKITYPDVIILLCAVLSGAGGLAGGFSPFGASCITALFMCSFSPCAALFVILGKLLSGIDAECLKYITAYLFITGVSAKQWFFASDRRGILVCAVCVLLSDTVYGAFAGFSFYFVCTSLLEVLLCALLVMPYKTVFSYFTCRKIRRTVTKKELAALSLVLCGCLSGLSGVVLPFDITVTGIVSTFILFFSAYAFSLGTCGVLGTALGVFASLANPNMIYSVGSYSVAAIVCSLCKRYGKGGIITGFILSNAAITFYVNGSSQVLINLYEILIAGGLFMFMPAKKLKQMKNEILLLLDRNKMHENTRNAAFKSMTFKRLNRISDAFSVLSLSMQKGGKARQASEAPVIDMLAENIKERVCGACAHRADCENCATERDGMLKNLVLTTKRRGWVEQYDVPSYFKNHCLDYGKLVLECNKVYELYRVNRVWENRIAENRELVSRQLKDVSGVVKSLASELYEADTFETEAESAIIQTLDGLGIPVENVSVTKDLSGRLKISATVLNCSGKNVCEREIKTVIKKVTGKSFAYVKHACDKEKCMIEYKEEENFEANVGISRVRPGNEKESGDSYAIIHPGGGKIVVALSDGMGTGERAAKESGETVSLLKHLLTAGIDREAAIKLINSVLILKSYDESFATLDMLIADLFTGEGEFVKTGGACSYIARRGEVAAVHAHALPTGIIGEMETANRSVLLEDGDIVMLASDGVTDICKDDKWIRDMLIRLSASGAQEIADAIMGEACRRVMTCKDDMTVIIIKISEK